MSPRPAAGAGRRWATLLAAGALALTGCGGEGDSASDSAADSASAPGEQPGTITEPEAGPPAPAPETEPGYDPAKPDTERNDVPPPPGSGAEAMEQVCAENPGAC